MQIVVRASVVFLFLLLFTRVLGRKELAEMSSFELIALIVMGDLIQQGVTQTDNSLTAAILAVSTMGLWMLALSYLSYKNSRARRLLEGQPVVIVKDGKLMKKMLEYERLAEDEVKDAAREQGIGDLSLVATGILEADGKFSFIRFDDRRAHSSPDREQ